MSSRNKNRTVRSIDLTRTDLASAQRRCEELGKANVELQNANAEIQKAKDEAEIREAACRIEMQEKYDKIKGQHQQAKEKAKKQQAWIDELAMQILVYRKFLADSHGYPPDIDADCMVNTGSGTLTYYLRPYAHYAPQILATDVLYCIDRQCLTCGLNIPPKGSFGKCPNCPRKAWYCSSLCQRAHWPVHRYDHESDPERRRPDLGGF